MRRSGQSNVFMDERVTKYHQHNETNTTHHTYGIHPSMHCLSHLQTAFNENDIVPRSVGICGLFDPMTLNCVACCAIHWDNLHQVCKLQSVNLSAGMLTRTNFRIHGQGQGHGLHYQCQSQWCELYVQGQGQGLMLLRCQGQSQGHCFLKDFSRTFADSMFHLHHSLHCFILT